MSKTLVKAKNGLFLFVSLVCLVGIIGFSVEKSPDQKLESIKNERKLVAEIITPYIENQNFQPIIESCFDCANNNDTQKLNIKYTIDENLQAQAEQILKLYKPDFGAIFMMNAETGKVLAMTSYVRNPEDKFNLNLKASYPAASVFKIVTATAAVDKAGLTPDEKIKYNGGAHTLYRRNVMSDKINRWTNIISFKDAFARSINTVFGRISLMHLEPTDLETYANNFGFNQEIPADFIVEPGMASVPTEKTFELTEVASGYNRSNKMSPVLGAMIASSVVNDGHVAAPYIVDEISTEDGTHLYKSEPLRFSTVMTKESAEKVREMMERTLIAGTSRKSFKSLIRDRRFNEVEMGGKTGHLTGTNPRGRVDWFVGYAFDNSEKIALAAITINKKYWTVKSSYLGQTMFRKYFEPQVVAHSKQKRRAVASQ